MVKYVYYDPNENNQIKAEIDTPEVVDWETWVDRGYLRAMVPGHLDYLTRDFRIVTMDDDTTITGAAPSADTDPPEPSAEDKTFASAKLRGRDKLKALGLSDLELEAMGLYKMVQNVRL